MVLATTMLGRPFGPLRLADIRSLATAGRVQVIADGAAWIWNVIKDGFPNAVQRLDLFHANSYLWAVAHELHGAGSAAARQWVKPLSGR